MTNFLVDSDKKLSNLVSKLKDIKEIGLDTEFIRESYLSSNTSISTNIITKWRDLSD
jgi:hypothetical protein